MKNWRLEIWDGKKWQTLGVYASDKTARRNADGYAGVAACRVRDGKRFQEVWERGKDEPNWKKYYLGE